jgi:hypothetical protein
VEDVRRVSGENLQHKADILNAEVAEFGEEYRIEEENGQPVLVKVRKL